MLFFEGVAVFGNCGKANLSESEDSQPSDFWQLGSDDECSDSGSQGWSFIFKAWSELLFNQSLPNISRFQEEHWKPDVR